MQAQERASQIIIQPNIKRHEHRKTKECPHRPERFDGRDRERTSDNRIIVESDAIDKRIEELRAAQKDLQQATEKLEKATVTLNEAITALKSATNNSANIVTGINNAIINAQEKTEYKVSIAQEDMELLMKNSQAVLATDEIVMKRHFEKQAQAMETHERKISSILNRNQGFWVSDFWAKVFCWVILLCSLLTLIAYHLKTSL